MELQQVFGEGFEITITGMMLGVCLRKSFVKMPIYNIQTIRLIDIMKRSLLTLILLQSTDSGIDNVCSPPRTNISLRKALKLEYNYQHRLDIRSEGVSFGISFDLSHSLKRYSQELRAVSVSYEGNGLLEIRKAMKILRAQELTFQSVRRGRGQMAFDVT